MPGGTAEVSGGVACAELLAVCGPSVHAGAASSSTISAPHINKRIRSSLRPPSIVMHSIGDNQQVAHVYFRKRRRITDFAYSANGYHAAGLTANRCFRRQVLGLLRHLRHLGSGSLTTPDVSSSPPTL